MNTVSEALDYAADLLERDGWIRVVMRRTVNGKIVGRCAIGALEDASAALQGSGGLRDSFELREAIYRLYVVIGRKNIPPWNDAPGRTQEEVVAALRMAAERERQEP